MYLMLHKRVELLKPKLGNVDLTWKTSMHMRTSSFSYTEVNCNERLIPILRSLPIQCKQPKSHALGPYQESDVQISPKCIPEIVILQRQVMKKSPTVPRPALVDEFLENLKSGVREDTKRKAITFDTEHLNEFIQNITNNVMRMQREAYEE
nr:coiled coil domain containing protein 162 [Hymenolepis microstoma]